MTPYGLSTERASWKIKVPSPAMTVFLMPAPIWSCSVKSKNLSRPTSAATTPTARQCLSSRIAATNGSTNAYSARHPTGHATPRRRPSSRQTPRAAGGPAHVGDRAAEVVVTRERRRFAQDRLLAAPLNRPSLVERDRAEGAVRHAAAVVAESGGVLSHSSIVAREFGIPCVVSAPGACDIPPGSEVVVDGLAGTVTVVRRGAAA